MPAILLLFALLAAGHAEGTADCNRKLDLVLIVDGCSGICGGAASCPEWKSILQFSKNIVDGLSIGQGGSRVAFVKFTDKARVEWGLNNHTVKSSLMSDIGNVPYTGGEWESAAGDSKIITQDVFNVTNGNKLGVPKVAIVISDGIKNIDPELAAEASNAIQMAGIKMYMVCITKKCSDTLAQSIASPPKQDSVTSFHAENYLSVDDVREALMKQICAS